MAQPKTIYERLTVWVGSPTSVLVHTLVFVSSFMVGVFHLADWTIVLLVLTTALSLEAIYLAIFIQMTVNRHAQELADVSEDVEDIQEDIEEISEDIDEIQEDVEDITEEGEGVAMGQPVTLEQLSVDIRRVLADIEALKLK